VDKTSFVFELCLDPLHPGLFEDTEGSKTVYKKIIESSYYNKMMVLNNLWRQTNLEIFQLHMVMFLFISVPWCCVGIIQCWFTSLCGRVARKEIITSLSNLFTIRIFLVIVHWSIRVVSGIKFVVINSCCLWIKEICFWKKDIKTKVCHLIKMTVSC